MNPPDLSDRYSVDISQVEPITQEEIIKALKLSLRLPKVIASLLERRIVEQTAKEVNITLSAAQLQQFADRYRKEHQLISSQATLKWLAKYSLSGEEFEELISVQLLAEKVAEYLFEDRVEPFYYAHHQDYSQVVMYEIVLKDYNLALELFYGIQEGELNFWDVAHQYIQNEELRRCGGYQGIKTRAQLSPQVATAVFAVEQNLPQVLKPIVVHQQAHLIYVEKIILPELNDSLRDCIRHDLFKNWLKKQRQQITDSFLNADNL